MTWLQTLHDLGALEDWYGSPNRTAGMYPKLNALVWRFDKTSAAATLPDVDVVFHRRHAEVDDDGT